MASFEIGRKYWCSEREYSALVVVDRTEKTVAVWGWKLSRHRIQKDENGNEYFVIKDHPDVFHYRAQNRC